MKKYNKPTIEALALETIDVIATSGNVAAQEALEAGLGTTAANGTKSYADQIDSMDMTWSW